ncbi:uncharacterized protein EI97DRAFT_436160 [Westerdykella ornata]|uniref:Uncharacterized protein n=1 Tax=Westerdykella ornata TaxID=318751 RepID=A0A6A6J9L7_WESOR|nr:uncharacterized protein EI97DRAFT_436160 [Westerdykella ornata]KAF2273280.1 hypothetical protein EI97DRAFT_436160 [Westerdykella ornata]
MLEGERHAAAAAAETALGMQRLCGELVGTLQAQMEKVVALTEKMDEELRVKDAAIATLEQEKYALVTPDETSVVEKSKADAAKAREIAHHHVKALKLSRDEAAAKDKAKDEEIARLRTLLREREMEVEVRDREVRGLKDVGRRMDGDYRTEVEKHAVYARQQKWKIEDMEKELNGIKVGKQEVSKLVDGVVEECADL